MGKGVGILLDDKMDFHVVGERNEKGLIETGLIIGDVTKQNQRIIIMAEKGEIKEAPLLGVGIASFLDDDNPSELLREIRTNLRKDGQKVKSCGFKQGVLVIEGGYED